MLYGTCNIRHSPLQVIYNVDYFILFHETVFKGTVNLLVDFPKDTFLQVKKRDIFFLIRPIICLKLRLNFFSPKFEKGYSDHDRGVLELTSK